MNGRGVLGDFDPHDPLIAKALEYKNDVYGELLDQYCAEIDGASRFVRAFAETYGIENRLAIASTAIRRDIDTFTDRMGLREYFPDERVFDVDVVTRPKPHPEAFDKAFRSLDLPDSSRPYVYAFEDDPRGMQSARGAGLKVVAITTRYDRAYFEQLDPQPDIIVDTYQELGQKLRLNGY